MVSLIASMIAMAHALDMRVVAEGVENHRKMQLLKTPTYEFERSALACNFARTKLDTHSESPLCSTCPVLRYLARVHELPFF